MAFATTNPATGDVELTVRGHTPEEVDQLVSAAARAFEGYRRMGYSDRGHLMSAASELLQSEQPVAARILTTEMGKTFAEAKAEVSKCAMALRWFAEHAEELLADEQVMTAASESVVRYQPLGILLAVMPWNFPLWQVVRFAAPALMAGNVGLLKHASNVPQTAMYLADLFRRAGYPDGVFTNLLVDEPAVAELIADERVAAVTLTGSERAGQAVGAAAGKALKKCVLELGGSDPFVVLASADLDAAVPAAVRARIQNNGQSCIAAKRFIVQQQVFDDFKERYVEEMSSLRVGDPFDPSTDVGPLASEHQRETIDAQVEDAKEKGAVVECGGEPLDGPGWYYRPTVLTGVTATMKVVNEEVFGPVAVLQAVSDAAEAISLANRTPYGLGASVWGRDEETLRQCIEEIDAGQVFVNAVVVSTPEMPFGGVKRSGYGRELSALGIKEFCNAKSVWVA